MKARQEIYTLGSSVVYIQELESHYSVGFLPQPEYTKDGPTGKFLARFCGFPGQIGAGDSVEEAVKSLREVFSTYVDLFIEENTLEAFRNRLIKNGFKLTGFDRYKEREAELIIPQQQSWEEVPDFVLKRTFIPPKRSSIAS